MNPTTRHGMFATSGLLVTVLSMAASSTAVETESKFTVESGVRQLFFDDACIEKFDGLKRVTHQAKKHPQNPVLRREHPWEHFRALLYGTVLYDQQEKLFKMWYCAIPRDNTEPAPIIDGKPRVPWVTLVAYATSKDGLKWKKPILRQLSYEGSKENNLVAIGRDNIEGISVMYQPDEPHATRRYKALFWEHRSYKASEYKVPPYKNPQKGDWRAGMWAAFSPDGVHWKNYGCVIPQHSDTNQTVIYDPKLRKYVLFNRIGVGRRVARTTSSDFIHWGASRLVLAADGKDPPGTQIYGFTTTPYENLYVGLPWMFYLGTDERIDVQLAHSRDGIKWHRAADRTAVVPNGPAGAWDAGDIRMPGSPITVGDTIYIYYSAAPGAHGTKFKAKYKPLTHEWFQAYRSMHIGLATLRRDGWVSLEAGDTEGSLLTKPFSYPVGTLHVNTDARQGQVRVAIIAADGMRITQSEPITGNQLHGAVNFKSDPPKAGRSVRMKFTFRNAKLYSFWWK